MYDKVLYSEQSGHLKFFHRDIPGFVILGSTYVFWCWGPLCVVLETVAPCEQALRETHKSQPEHQECRRQARPDSTEVLALVAWRVPMGNQV